MDTIDQYTWIGGLVTGMAISRIASGRHGIIDGKVRTGYLHV
jgi:membrane-associated phospholipid phosphatase